VFRSLANYYFIIASEFTVKKPCQ